MDYLIFAYFYGAAVTGVALFLERGSLDTVSNKKTVAAVTVGFWFISLPLIAAMKLFED